MRWRRGLLSCAVLGCSPALSRACTVCQSATAEAVRRGIVETHPVRTLLAVVLPFAILTSAVWLVDAAMPLLLADGVGQGRRRTSDEGWA